MSTKDRRPSAQSSKELAGNSSEFSGVVAGSTLESIIAPKGKQKSYVMDLRIHTPVSLGYLAIDGIDTAPALVRLAKVKGLNLIAVTDFISGAFIDSVRAAASSSGIVVVPGTVIRCRLGNCDDIVVSALFPESFTSQSVEEFLDSLGVPREKRGQKGYIVEAPFEKIVAKVEALGGVILPSRMDKTPHRLSAVPLLVDQFGFRAFDLAYPETSKFFKARWPKIKFQLFSFSNANALAQIGSRVAKVKMNAPGFAGVKELLQRGSVK